MHSTLTSQVHPVFVWVGKRDRQALHSLPLKTKVDKKKLYNFVARFLLEQVSFPEGIERRNSPGEMIWYQVFRRHIRFETMYLPQK